MSAATTPRSATLSAPTTSRPTSTVLERAVAAGVPVAGYFVWTLMDNFEWSLGYGTRFGLVYVDFATLERVPKSSFHWYREFLSEVRNGHPR